MPKFSTKMDPAAPKNGAISILTTDSNWTTSKTSVPQIHLNQTNWIK